MATAIESRTVFDCYGLVGRLFAYLYQEYERTGSPDHLRLWPYPTTYVISDFPVSFGKCLIKVNRFLRPCFTRIMDGFHRHICRNKGSFYAYSKHLSFALEKHFKPPIVILAFSAIVAGMNYWCFKQGCYRFSYFTVQCLNENLISSKRVQLYIQSASAENDLGLNRLAESCTALLQEMETDNVPQFLLDIEQKILAFEHNRRAPAILSRSLKVFYDDKSAEMSKSGDENDIDPQPVNPNPCHICGKVDCRRYMRRFLRYFTDGYMKWGLFYARYAE